MYSFALFMGLWITTCLQTQINDQQGHVIESYSIESMGQYQFKRTWFEDKECKNELYAEEEIGQITLGSKLQGMFMTDKTVEANFHAPEGVDLGALGVTQDGKLKVARGFKGSTFRNTMLSIFDYSKQKDHQDEY